MIAKVSIQVMGQSVKVRARVYSGRSEWCACAAYGNGLGWAVHRLDDGTEVVHGLDREVAMILADALSKISDPRLDDLQAELRRLLGSFAL